MTVTKQKPTTAYNEVNKAYLKSEMRSLGRSKRLGSYANGLDSDSGSSVDYEENEGKVSVELHEVASPPQQQQCPFTSSPQSNTQTQTQSSSNSSLLSSMLNTAPLCDSSDLLVSFEDLSCKGMSGISGEEENSLIVQLNDSDEEEDGDCEEDCEEDDNIEDEEMERCTGGSDGENSNPGAKIFCTEHIGSVLLDGKLTIFLIHMFP